MMVNFIFIFVQLVDMKIREERKELTKIKRELIRLQKRGKIFKNPIQYKFFVNKTLESFFIK
ncbi:MAG: hypothetical protein DRI88_12005 [Bacteroidetes bacterium]|nr:MAG: hypothetical protein DRI88_12005 [Bacteroidota bacterium]